MVKQRRKLSRVLATLLAIANVVISYYYAEAGGKCHGSFYYVFYEILGFQTFSDPNFKSLLSIYKLVNPELVLLDLKAME